MQNFDVIDKEIFEKKSNSIYSQNGQYHSMIKVKTIKISNEIDRIWNSKEDPNLINKIFA